MEMNKIADVLVITDLHKRWTETTIKGLLDAQEKIQNDLCKFNRENEITHNILAGDWYDRGYTNIGGAYMSWAQDRNLAASVTRGVYLTVGNHMFLDRDSNPEIYCIQPNTHYAPVGRIYRDMDPIFNVVKYLVIGTVQFSFFHYSKTNKDYRCERQPGVKLHIGIYHDEAVLPGYIRAKDGFNGELTTWSMDTIYDNIDIGIYGHIHSKIGKTEITLSNGRKVMLWGPGAIGISQNKEAHKHFSVELPRIIIYEDGSYEIREEKFRTYVENMQFVKKKETKSTLERKKLKTGEIGLVQQPSDVRNYETYMNAKNYTDKQREYVSLAFEGKLDLVSACSIEISALKEALNDN